MSIRVEHLLHIFYKRKPFQVVNHLVKTANNLCRHAIVVLLDSFYAFTGIGIDENNLRFV